ncbi:unnamed protein product [Ambrosiozyma monospora]|uniref:Unnamed protein product n=1 Tax=Ambrosiozyma monospora TaxID=43982 RepID=A0A9W7DEB2_AMBMO|nr:unnamed protein product [Ambrosiozyma monospora]
MIKMSIEMGYQHLFITKISSDPEEFHNENRKTMEDISSQLIWATDGNLLNFCDGTYQKAKADSSIAVFLVQLIHLTRFLMKVFANELKNGHLYICRSVRFRRSMLVIETIMTDLILKTSSNTLKLTSSIINSFNMHQDLVNYRSKKRNGSHIWDPSPGSLEIADRS